MAQMGRQISVLKPLYVVEHWQLAEADAGRQHLIDCGFDLRLVEPWRGDKLPVLTGEEVGVMIMGGPQMITEASSEKYSYLLEELSFIEEAMDKSVPLVGVCLGSQMIAQVLGAKVGFHPRDEIAMGFYPLNATPHGQELGLSDGMMVLDGNAQGWEAPHAATMLATSPDENPWPNQAFSIDKTLALQFHPEVTRKILDQWQTDFASSIGRSGTQSKRAMDEGFKAYDAVLKAWYKGALEDWFTV